ncbi:unnamed protein product [Caenorhabditis bovis]|uniref:Uncharacterized protein n=1 Tax=Caenorhabditis bovis TaxID=2654633 RepID=A0A8S1ET58_9PELO|nr:unnamed protein product [Caenorhabditis bovis]
MSSLKLCLLFALIGLAASQFNMDCKIKVKFRQDSHQKVRIDLLIPSLSIMSDPVILDEFKEEKHVNIKGKNCERKHWVFMIYGEDEHGNWVLKKKHKAKFTGHGWFLVSMAENYEFQILDRMGVMCSEGMCGK